MCLCYLTAALGIEPYTRELRPLYRPLTPWLFTVCFTQSPASGWRRCSSSVVNMKRRLQSRQEEASLYFHCQQCALFVGAPFARAAGGPRRQTPSVPKFTNPRWKLIKKPRDCTNKQVCSGLDQSQTEQSVEVIRQQDAELFFSFFFLKLGTALLDRREKQSSVSKRNVVSNVGNWFKTSFGENHIWFIATMLATQNDRLGVNPRGERMNSPMPLYLGGFAFSSSCSCVFTYSVGKVMQISMPPAMPPGITRRKTLTEWAVQQSKAVFYFFFAKSVTVSHSEESSWLLCQSTFFSSLISQFPLGKASLMLRFVFGYPTWWHILQPAAKPISRSRAACNLAVSLKAVLLFIKYKDLLLLLSENMKWHIKGLFESLKCSVTLSK